MVAAVNAAESAGDSEQANTVARLRMTFLKHIPLDAIDHTDVQAHVSHVSPSGTTMLERTCAALLAILPNSKRQASAALNGAAPKVCRTLAEQDVYIKEIWNQHRINYQDPEWLQDKLAKARKVSYSRGSQRRGRGNYQGTRGGGRGDTSKQNGASGSSDKFAPGAKGTATADRAEAAVDPEAFCAHMNLDISHDLESERLLHPQTVPLTTWDESTDNEDSDNESMAPSLSEEPPVYAHPEGPPPLTVPHTTGLTWYAKLTVVFLVTLISILVMFPDVLAALDISIPKTVVGSVLAGASLLNTTNGRRYSLMGFCLSAFVFLSFCNFSADAATLDLQLPGSPTPALHKGFTPFSPSSFGSPTLSDYIANESTAFMVSQGDPSNFNLKWCMDCGANRHISNALLDFTSNYRTASINITVAKQNITMQAVTWQLALVIVMFAQWIIWGIHANLF